MNDDRGPQSGLKSVRTYLPMALKFYELGKDRLTPALFMLILLISFSGNFIGGPGQEAGAGTFFAYILSVILVQMAYATYLYAFIRDRRGEAYTITHCVIAVLRNSGGIILVFIAYTIITFLGLLFFIIPGIILAIMFTFGTCFVVDRSMRVTDALSESRRRTQGVRLEIFGIYLVFFLILLIPMTVIVYFALSSGNSLVLAFVLSFVSILVNLMSLRMTALMYLDLAGTGTAAAGRINPKETWNAGGEQREDGKNERDDDIK